MLRLCASIRRASSKEVTLCVMNASRAQTVQIYRAVRHVMKYAEAVRFQQTCQQQGGYPVCDECKQSTDSSNLKGRETRYELC